MQATVKADRYRCYQDVCSVLAFIAPLYNEKLEINLKMETLMASYAASANSDIQLLIL